MATKKTKVEVYGETSKYERSMRNVKRTSQSTSKSISSHWGKTFGTLTKLSAAFGIAGAAGFVMLGKKALDTADAIGKTADKIGIGTDALQEYQYAAELSGIEQATLNSGLEAFTKRLGEAQVGTGALVTYLNKYNETLLANIQASGSTEEALGYIFEAMGNMTDASDRAALSAAAFGRTAGIDMTILVREGTIALEQMRQAARDLGLVMDESLIREAEKANDALTTLSSVISIQMTSALVSMAPQITQITQDITDWIKANKDLINQNVSAVIRGLGDAFIFTCNAIMATSKAFDRLLDIIMGPAMGDAQELARKGFEKQLELALRSYDIMLKQGNIEEETLKVAKERISTLRQKIDMLSEINLLYQKAQKYFLAHPPDTLPGVPPDTRPPKAREVPAGEPRLDYMEMETQLTSDLYNEMLGRGEQMLALEKIQAEFRAEQYQEQAQASLEEKSALEIYMAGQLYHDLEAMRWQHHLTMEELKKKEKESLMTQLGVYQSHAANVANTFLQISQAGGKQSKEAFRVYQAFAIVEAGISAARAIIMALGAPPGPPWSFVLAGITGAMAAVQIGLIAGAKPPSYDRGGISTAPGMYYAGIPEAHVPLKGGAIPVALDRGGGDIFIVMNNPVFQDLETQQAVFADIASQITERVAPNALVRAYNNDHPIRGMIRSRA